MINRRLYDILLRQQMFLEGFKNFQNAKFRKELPKLVKDLRKEFAKVPYKVLDDMTKKELNDFQRNIKRVNNQFFDYWNKVLLRDLDEFMETEFAMDKSILANYHYEQDKSENEVLTNEKQIDKIIKENSKEEDTNKLVPFAWVFDNETDKLKAKILSAIIPATGTLTIDFLNTLSEFSLKRIASTINRGFVDKKTLNEILEEITGTKDNGYKDGILIPLSTAETTITNTVIQHAAALMSAFVLATTYNKYQWRSVMDSRTTDICISRNNKVYTYGKGPLPPAHPRCRSKVAPYLGFDIPQENFSKWVGRQPDNIKKYAESNFAALSKEEYSSMLSRILTR